MDVFNFLPSFKSRNQKRGTDKRRTKTTPRADLRLESLEDRLVMAASIISGFVYADVNNNGLFDAGEKPIANSSIQLKNTNGTVIGQTITDANGFYQFTTDSTISTTPAIITKTASIPTTNTDWTQTLTVPQFDPSLGTLTSIDIINAGTFTSSIKVESLDGGPSTIVATVSGNLTLSGNGVNGLIATGSSSKTYGASAFDGTIDFGGTSGHDFGSPSTFGTNTITLSDPASLALYSGLGGLTFTNVAHATSSASGAGNLLSQIGTTANAQVQIVYHYIPSNSIKPGNYVVVQTVQPPGYIDGKESSGGVVIPNSIGTDLIPIVFNGSTSTNNNFGELQASSLGGFVYVDTNNNGIKELTEAGIGGVTVTLTGTSDIGAVSLTTTTAADGSYNFANLRPGTYSIRETQPAAYLDGKDTLGSLSGTVVNDFFSNITLPTATNGINYNFGEIQASSLAGNVYVDNNNNGVKDANESGIAGVTVTLTGNDDLGATVNLTTTTAADGSYIFATLRPGTYNIRETQPSAYLDGKDTIGSLSGIVANDFFSNIIVPASTSGVNYNFGEIQFSSLSGYVYVDNNNNGFKDPTEVGISGVTVTLTGTDDVGAVSLTTTTGADGRYNFPNLRPGSYSVRETQPSAYFDGKDSLGSLSGTATNDFFSNISVPGGVSGINYNFGELLASSLAGKVYVDANASGTLDAGEVGIGSVTLTLTGTDDLGNAVNATTTTAADGTYSFNNLRPGTYQVVETQPANYVDGKATAGSVGGVIATNRISNVPLPSATNAVSYNFGEVNLGSLSGRVWFDQRNNGVIDPGESFIAGVTITLTGTNDQGTAISATTTTAADGSYSFFGLRPGTYTITETQPAQYKNGQQMLGSLGGQVALNQFLNVPLQVNQNGVEYNFGEIKDPIDNIVQPPPPFVPININMAFLSKLQLLSNSQQIIQQATQLAYYIDGVYTVTLGRHADMDGLSYFTYQMLLGTQTRQSFVNYMMNTPEHFALQVNAGFVAILGRQADAGAINYYSGLLAAGVSVNSMDASLIASAEFQAQTPTNQGYVQTLYEKGLGRSASNADVAFWTGQLNGGVSRASVALTILNSTESIAQSVNLQYLSILGRTADTASLNQWVSMIQSRQLSEPALQTILLCSNEFYTRVMVAAHLI